MPQPPLTTQRLRPDPAGLQEAAEMLRAGQTLAFPTETVYGLGADARSDEAVARIYEAKARPSFNPLIVHVAEVAAAQKLVVWNDVAETLAAAFWPGPLTLVLPLTETAGISTLVTAGLDTLAVRCPAAPVAQALLRTAQIPLAAPSANPSGRISPTTADHVMGGLSGRIGAVLDGGACTVGVESTILLASDTPVLLRPGGIAQEEIEAVLGHRLALPETDAAISAPGQLRSHYAPQAQLKMEASQADPGGILIGFGAISGDFSLSEEGDLSEAATRLFPTLHRADALGRPIAVAPIPDEGLGRAINDRLRRAAAPRD